MTTTTANTPVTDNANESEFKGNAPKIERIYVSRGDNLFNYDGIKSDKFFGLVIEGSIYWMNHSFATLEELGRQLGALKIHMDEKGAWGQTKKDGWATLSNKVTRISKHHDDIFVEDTETQKGTKYLKDAVFFKDGMIWWYMSDLKAKLFPEM